MSIHQDIQDRFDDLLRGVLSPRERREVEEHLASCSACAEEFALVRALLEGAEALPREIEPTRELWAGIEARIVELEHAEASPDASLALPTPARPLLPRWLAGFRPRLALVTTLAAAAIVLALTRWPSGEPEPEPTVEVVVDRPDAPASGRFQVASDAPIFVASLVRGLEMQCVGAARELRASVDRSDSPLDAAMTGALESDVQLLDRAIAETRSALEGDPEDPNLLHMLTSQYQRKLSLFQQALRLAGEA